MPEVKPGSGAILIHDGGPSRTIVTSAEDVHREQGRGQSSDGQSWGRAYVEALRRQGATDPTVSKPTRSACCDTCGTHIRVPKSSPETQRWQCGPCAAKADALAAGLPIHGRCEQCNIHIPIGRSHCSTCQHVIDMTR